MSCIMFFLIIPGYLRNVSQLLWGARIIQWKSIVNLMISHPKQVHSNRRVVISHHVKQVRFTSRAVISHHVKHVRAGMRIVPILMSLVLICARRMLSLKVLHHKQPQISMRIIIPWELLLLLLSLLLQILISYAKTIITISHHRKPLISMRIVVS